MPKNIAILILTLLFSGCTSISATPDASVGEMPGNGPVGKTMKANAEKFEDCARDSITVQTETIQHLVLRFTVTPDGEVVRPEVTRMVVPDPDLRACILHVLKKIKFPPPNDGTPKTIEYPLTLRAD